MLAKYAFALLTTLVIATLLITATTSHISAGKPANVPCECGNGAVRDTSVSYCLCTSCNSPYLLPFCTFETNKLIRFAITYQFTGNKTFFPFDTAESNVKNHFSVNDNAFNWIQRITRFENGQEVVVEYLVESSIANSLYNDVYSSSPPQYLESPRAKDMWQLGTVVSQPGIFSKHYQKGKVLGSYKVSGGTVDLVDAQLEFFIGGLCVVVATPLLEFLLFYFLHPTTEELDEEEMKHGDHSSKDPWDASNENEMQQQQQMPPPPMNNTDVMMNQQQQQQQHQNNYDYISPAAGGNPLEGSGNNNASENIPHATYDNNNNNMDGLYYGNQDASSPPPPPPQPEDVEFPHHNKLTLAPLDGPAS